MVAKLTSFAIVREREVRTPERLMVTPIRSFELIVGKIVPFFFVGLALVTLITLVATIWFQVPFRGNPLVLRLGIGSALMALAILRLKKSLD